MWMQCGRLKTRNKGVNDDVGTTAVLKCCKPEAEEDEKDI